MMTPRDKAAITGPLNDRVHEWARRKTSTLGAALDGIDFGPEHGPPTEAQAYRRARLWPLVANAVQFHASEIYYDLKFLRREHRRMCDLSSDLRLRVHLQAKEFDVLMRLRPVKPRHEVMDKLSAVTVERGATPNEAAVAATKLARLKAEEIVPRMQGPPLPRTIGELMARRDAVIAERKAKRAAARAIKTRVRMNRVPEPDRIERVRMNRIPEGAS